VPPVKPDAPGERAAQVWEALAPRLVYPVKLTIIESLLWFDEPLSASKLARTLDDSKQHSVSTLAYHMRQMVDAGVLKPVGRCTVKGTTEIFYDFAAPSARRVGRGRKRR
jgi:hypothetical protein